MTMTHPIERVILSLDRALRTLASVGAAERPSPSENVADAPLDDAERRRSAALMRVNHAGEVAAQALYDGQALTARLDTVRAAMQRSADEETDHLAWCRARIRELGGRPSLLNPLWYAGSFAIGAAAGIAGDRWSLGFVAETERQVVRHLDSHLEQLPADDARSRAILTQMRADEEHHGTVATDAGGQPLPAPIRSLMRCTSLVMTRTAYRV
ncbi:MAG: 2-polyprenyl-3-methyl-6-methoxy-1,4-benzoquinone monooxygenase [Xanthomonadaceae bacterium]|nr:2-polyprenyl-3-methyl-6-methoxy-1,4-benzoquinone monooxygenase [Xanthomonadaceae bacterium]